MSSEELKEEVTNWDKVHFAGDGKAVFQEAYWGPLYEGIMRADFRLFDEYKFKHNGAPKFDFPLHAWHMEAEHFNKPEMIEMWKDWTTGKFDFKVMKGMGHLTCFYKPDLKKVFFTEVT